MARKFYLMAIVFVALLMMGCSDDEKGMYFTKDEIVQGDINTGKQVGIKDNTIDVYTTEQGYVNVQGAVGKISATSVDENVAVVELCINSDEKVVWVKGVSVGKTKITVTDSDGNSATFIVNVKDVETAWKQTNVYSLQEKYCVVEGVSKEDSLQIASTVIANDKKAMMVEKTRDTFPGSMTRAIMKDKQDNVLVDGILLHERDENGTKFWIVPFDSYSSVVLDQFYTDTKMGQFLIWDLTSVYKEEYPAVTSVKLYVKCSRLL